MLRRENLRYVMSDDIIGCVDKWLLIVGGLISSIECCDVDGYSFRSSHGSWSESQSVIEPDHRMRSLIIEVTAYTTVYKII
jgi:hypothetical protein